MDRIHILKPTEFFSWATVLHSFVTFALQDFTRQPKIDIKMSARIWADNPTSIYLTLDDIFWEHTFQREIFSEDNDIHLPPSMFLTLESEDSKTLKMYPDAFGSPLFTIPSSWSIHLKSFRLIKMAHPDTPVNRFSFSALLDNCKLD